MPSDFIQIDNVAVRIDSIEQVIFRPTSSGANIFITLTRRYADLVLEGAKAIAFRNWWETKASVNVLYTELEEPVDESPA